jgi:hypothetical protein
MKLLIVLLSGLAVLGCNPPVEPAKSAAPPLLGAKKPGPPVGGAGIAPMGTPAVGGLTPVGNTDSVQGAGMGGVGQAAKIQARKAAASGESSSANQTSGE